MTAGPMTRGQHLKAEAAEAAEVREALTHPDVVALRVEKIRAQVDWLIWAGMILGLLFTMANVQQFTAHTINAEPGSLGWWAAWLLDPAVSVILLGVLLAEREVSRWQVRVGEWARAAKWSLLAATYVMNTWESWAAGSVSGIVLHSVPPLAVFMGAEAVTDCQHKLTEAVHQAHAWATERAERHAKADRDRQANQTVPPQPVAYPAAEGSGAERTTTPLPVTTPAWAEGSQALGERVAPRSQPAVPAWGAMSGAEIPARPQRPAARRQTGRSATRRAPARGKSGGRVLFADYRALARKALTPDTEVTPAWVREVTGCSRGLSSRLAAELRTEHAPVPAVPPAAGEQSTDQPEHDVDRPESPEGKAA